MRFNSPDYLTAWVQTGKFPEIHDDIFDAVVNYSSGGVMLDLCCSTGLLTKRLQKFGAHVIGVDADSVAITAGLSFNIENLQQLKVTRETVSNLVNIVLNQRVRVLIARRCFPELFGEDLEFGREFAGLMASNGIEEIFIEGRVKTRNAINALATLDSEVSLFANHYTEKRRIKNVAILTLKT